jgi:putative ABC transport system permease protein
MPWSHLWRRRRERDQELVRELDSYVAHEIDDQVAAGRTLEEAHIAAHRKLGNVTRVREEVYEMHSLQQVESFWRDIRQAIRALRRTPWYSFTAISVIALGIALATTVFAVVDGVLFKPLPYERPRELYDVSGGFQRLPNLAIPSVSLPDVRAWMTAAPDVRFATVSVGGAITIADNEYLRSADVDRHFFDVLGVQPLFGGFQPDDFGPRTAVRPALVTYRVWQQRFGGTPDVIGRTMIDSGGEGLRVAGVLPEDFVFPHPAGRVAPEAIAPLPIVQPVSDDSAQRRWLQVLARVPPDVPLAAVEGRLRVAAAGVASQFPALGSAAGLSATRQITRGPFDVVRLRPLRDVLAASTRTVSAAIFVTAALLVLLACVNLAGLAGGRALDRRHELMLRRALGATGGRLARMLAIEHASVVIAGACLGIFISRWLLDVTLALTPTGVMLLKTPAIDWRAGAFAALASGLSIAAATVWSAYTTLRNNPRPVLAERGGATERAGSRRRAVLIGAQVALAMVMALAGSLLAASLARVWQEDPGFAPDRATRIRLSRPRDFDLVAINELLLAVRRIPGVVAVGGLDEPFLERAITGSSFEPPAGAGVDGKGDVEQLSVTSGFFRAAGLHATEGRLPTDEEFDTGKPVIIISQKAASLYWPGRSAIGRTLSSTGRAFEVIGVVPDARYRALDLDSDGEIYSPLAATRQPGLVNVIVAFDGDTERGLARVLGDMAARFPRVRVVRAESLADALSSSVQSRRFHTWLFVSFGVAALVIAGTGIFGLVAMATSRRTREIGVRIALGATPPEVVRLMIQEQLTTVVVGLAVGGLIAAWSVRFVESYVYKLSIYDLRPWAVAITALVTVTAVGVLVPALRASHTDPIRALRIQ